MDLTGAAWRKASRSASNGGQCVEVAALWRKARRSADNGGHCVELSRRTGAIAVRDSKNPTGPVLVFAPDAWREFTAAIKRH
jgi:hypothetical protein